MNLQIWDHLMADARWQAKVNQERRRVVGIRSSSAIRKATGKSWIYVVQCSDAKCVTCARRRGVAR